MTSLTEKIVKAVNGFRFRLTAFALAGILALSGISYFYTIRIQRDLFNKAYEKSIQNTLETVKIGIELGLSSENYEPIQKIFTWVKTDALVKFIVLTDENGIFATYPENETFDLNSLKAKAASGEKDVPVIVKSIDWKSQLGSGIIFMGFSTETIAAYEHKTFAELGSIGLLFVFSAAIIVFLLATKITNPLKRLQTASDEIRTGNFEARVNEDEGGNEIKAVAQAFNLMVKELTETQQKLEHDLNKAADFVEKLLPKKLEEPISIDWIFKPSDRLGGDTFGYHFLDEDTIAVYIIDVSGHGVGPALYSVSVLNMLKEEALTNTDFYDPSDLLQSLNAIFQLDKYDDKYFTIWYGVIDLKNNELKYSSAGHPPAILINPDGDTKYLSSGGIFIGAFPKTEYPVGVEKLQRGQAIYIFSDGVIEFRKKDKSMFSLDEFRNIILDFDSNDFSLDELMSVLNEMKSEQNIQDDVSLLRIII